MKNSELIKALSELPQEMEVCLFDLRKNLHHADEDGSAKGIEDNIDVFIMKEAKPKPFIALGFINDDYHEDGSPNMGSSIVSMALEDN